MSRLAEPTLELAQRHSPLLPVNPRTKKQYPHGFGVGITLDSKELFYEGLCNPRFVHQMINLVRQRGVALFQFSDQDSFDYFRGGSVFTSPKNSLPFHYDVNPCAGEGGDYLYPNHWSNGFSWLYQEPRSRGRLIDTLFSPTSSVAETMLDLASPDDSRLGVEEKKYFGSIIENFRRKALSAVDEDGALIMYWNAHFIDKYDFSVEEMELIESINQCIFKNNPCQLRVGWSGASARASALQSNGQVVIWDAGSSGATFRPLAHARDNNGLILTEETSTVFRPDYR